MKLYLIRHGQAGLRTHYDTLSDLGREQARALGHYLAAQKLSFGAVIAGGLERQQQTLAEARAAAAACGWKLPEAALDPAWNEFDIDTVNREIAPQLCAADPDFAREYAEMNRLTADPSHATHHEWLPCDVAIVRAWIQGRFPVSAESWAGFNARVAGNLRTLPCCPNGDSVAIFTSAAPIAVWTALATESPNHNVMRFSGVMYNTAITTFSYTGGELTLLDFNGIPHLQDARLRTLR